MADCGGCFVTNGKGVDKFLRVGGGGGYLWLLLRARGFVCEYDVVALLAYYTQTKELYTSNSISNYKCVTQL